MTRSSKITVGVAAVIGPSALPVHGQNISNRDTIRISSATVGIHKARTCSLTIHINTVARIMSFALPLSYAGHPALRIDQSVGQQGVTYELLGAGEPWVQRTVLIDTTQKTILLGFLSFGQPLQPSSGPLVTIHFKLDSTSLPGVVYVDSTFVPPYNRLAFVDYDAIEYTPQFMRGSMTITDQVPIIRFNVTSLTFWATVNSADPPAQNFQIINDGGAQLTWTATDDHGALLPSGLYVYRLTATGFTQSCKMVLLR